GVTGDFVVFTAPPAWIPPRASGRGRPATRHRLAPDNPPPVALSALAKQVRLRKGTWRPGSKGKLGARIAWLRVGPGHGGEAGARRAGLAAARGAGRRETEVRLFQPAARQQLQEGRPFVEEPLAGGTGLPTTQGGAGPGPLRGALLARVPPPRLPDVPRLR